jgi:hypothetical protein
MGLNCNHSFRVLIFEVWVFCVRFGWFPLYTGARYKGLVEREFDKRNRQLIYLFLQGYDLIAYLQAFFIVGDQDYYFTRGGQLLQMMQ